MGDKDNKNDQKNKTRFFLGRKARSWMWKGRFDNTKINSAL